MLEKIDLDHNNSNSDNKKDNNINDYIFPQYEEQQIKEAFDVFDFNGNNFISVNELKEIFHYINEEVTEEELDEMINLADKEGDGQVNWVNFYEFISGKTISTDVKNMEMTPGLYPEDNEIQHLKKTKIEFEKLNNEINDDKIETKRVSKETNKKNSINKSSPKDENLNGNGNKNVKNGKKKKKVSIIYNKNEDNNDNNINNEFEDAKINNYVQEILKKRQEKIQNNYFINNAKIRDIEDKPKKEGKKLIYIDNSQKKQIVTNGSLDESSSEVKSIDSNNRDNDNENNREEKETNKTKVSNFLPLDRTNTMKKINPVIQEINDSSIDEDTMKINNGKKENDLKEENDEDKHNEASFVKKKIKKIKITPKNKKSKKKVIKKEKEKEKEDN